MTLRGYILCAAALLLTAAPWQARAEIHLFGGTEPTPAESWRVECTTDSAACAIVERTAGPTVTGIWQATADGARVAVISGSAAGGVPQGAVARGSLLFVILRSPRPGILPGTVMGWATPTAKDGKWDARIFTATDGRTLSKPMRFTLTAGDNSHLQLVPVKKGLKISLWRWLPYMIRPGFTEVDDREKGLDGFLRVWPPSLTSPPPTPVYL